MPNKYYIADLHFGHRNVIQFDKRPFETIEEMDDELIRRWNSVVHRDDHVYILGDFTLSNVESAKEYASRLKGHLHLIRGNHDRKNEEYEKVFESADDLLYIRDRIYGQQREVALCHYWIPFVKNQRHGAFMLHGHTHITKEHILEEEMKEKIRQNGIRCEAYNVGCMFQDYYPQTLEQIVERQERSVVV